MFFLFIVKPISSSSVGKEQYYEKVHDMALIHSVQRSTLPATVQLWVQFPLGELLYLTLSSTNTQRLKSG